MKRIDSNDTIIMSLTPNNYPGYATPIADYLNYSRTTLDGIVVGTEYTYDDLGFSGTATSCVQDPYYMTWTCDHGYGSTYMSMGIPSRSVVKDASGAVLRDIYAHPIADDSSSTYWTHNLLDLPSYTTVSDGTNSITTNYSYDESGHFVTSSSLGSPGTLGLGHVTTISPASGITSLNYWTKFGVLDHTVDPKGNTAVTYEYDPSSFTSGGTTYYKALSPVQVTTPVGSESYGYDYNTSLVTSHTDLNSKTTAYTFDAFNRPWAVQNPDATSSYQSEVACYPSATSVKVFQAKQADLSLPSGTSATSCPSSSTAVVNTLNVDGLGRTISTIQNSVETDTTYDAMGRVASVTNPYVATPTGYNTTYGYDAISRPLTVTNQDSSTKSWLYAGPITTVKDEALNKTKTVTDALGRVIEVDEPTANNSTGSMLPTSYTYNLYGLTGVTQTGNGGETARTRSFTYDSLGRLLTATNPETGEVTYTYPVSSSLCAGDLSLPCSKEDARSVTTTYTYDSSNRLTEKQSSGGTGVPGFDYTYAYGTTANAIGRLATTNNNVDEHDAFTYDVMGRVASHALYLPSATTTAATLSASYDLAGNLTDLTHPDGLHVKQTWNTAGQLASVYAVDGSTTTATYLSSASYYPNGAPSALVYGNGVEEDFGQNNRLQTTSLAGSNSSATLMSRIYYYSNDGSHGLSGGCPSSGDNGNIWQITNSLSSSWTRKFSYDCMNRLTGAQVGSGTAASYWLDSFGNMSPEVSGTPVNTFSTTTNRISNLPCYSTGSMTPYDAEGNQLCDSDAYGAYRSYGYDAENKTMSVAMAGYSPFVSYDYSGAGDRIRKTMADSTFTEYAGLGGQTLSERDQTGYWTDYIYAGSQKIAKAPQTEPVVTISGTASGAGSYEYFPITTSLAGYTVQSGDKLQVRQRNHGVAEGGFNFNTDEAASGDWSYYGYDEDGQFSQNDTTADGVWHDRIFDISGMAGNHVALPYFDSIVTGAGAWSVDFTDYVIVSANGEVHPIYNGAGGISMGSWGGGMSSVTYTVGPVSTDAMGTRFYLGDHLGTAQMELSAGGTGGGWPVWSGQFDSYGQELSTDATSFKYKFTGQERDAESGNDYFHVRYFGSGVGRFMSPDPLGGHPEDPQTLNRYAYARNNPLLFSDPTGLDFNLTCTAAKDGSNASTCQGGLQGTTTTDANGKSSFNATVITSASLSDPNSGNTATVNENGVQIKTAQGTFQGEFINNTPAADLKGSDLLQDFSFTINGNCGGSCLSSGRYSYYGTNDQVRNLLDLQGAWRYTGDKDQIGLFGHSWDEVIFKDHWNTTQHRFGQQDSDLPSPHFSVPRDPSATVPSSGGFHVDKTGDTWKHAKDAACSLVGC